MQYGQRAWTQDQINKQQILLTPKSILEANLKSS